MTRKSHQVVLIIAHPDDEILWAGGTLLMHPEWRTHIICLCRKNDSDRSARFARVLKFLQATGEMGDLDDEPQQFPMSNQLVSSMIADLLPYGPFNLVITHSPAGEYTRHLRHEEIGAAVIRLWCGNKLSCKKAWFFAYDDGQKTHHPAAISSADIQVKLPGKIWELKYSIMKDIYGFKPGAWEAITTPRTEAFWEFRNSVQAAKWLEKLHQP